MLGHVRTGRDLSYFMSPEPSIGLAKAVLSHGMKVWMKQREEEEGWKGRSTGMREIQSREQAVKQEEEGAEVRRPPFKP